MFIPKEENILTKKVIVLFIFYLSLMVAFFCLLPIHNILLENTTYLHHSWSPKNTSENARLTDHDSILNNTAIAFYRYRVLTPFSTEIIANILSKFLSLSYSFSLFLSYAAFYVIVTFLALWFLYIYLSYWFAKEYSLIGILFTAISMIFAQRLFFTPYCALDTAFFIISLVLIREKKHLLFGLIIILSSLNRETALFLPFLFLFCNLDFKNFKKSLMKNFPIFVIYFAIYLCIIMGLVYIRGLAPTLLTLKETWILNTSLNALIYAAIYIFLFLGPFWTFSVLGLKHAPDFVKKSALIIPFSLPILIAIGSWQEVRLIMFWYPIIVPLGLSYLLRRKQQQDYPTD